MSRNITAERIAELRANVDNDEWTISNRDMRELLDLAEEALRMRVAAEPEAKDEPRLAVPCAECGGGGWVDAPELFNERMPMPAMKPCPSCKDLPVSVDRMQAEIDALRVRAEMAESETEHQRERTRRYESELEELRSSLGEWSAASELQVENVFALLKGYPRAVAVLRKAIR